MKHPMMKCGHSANSTSNEKPACAICAGIKDGWNVIDTSPPSLDERNASCAYCKKEVPSNTNLAFFERRSDKQTDSYYCGCRGWD